MNPRHVGRTAACTKADARQRLDQARAYLIAATLIADDAGLQAWASVATGCAVLAGIAAADAICCTTIGEHSRGQDHRQALDVLCQAVPDGPVVSTWLRRLLDLKDEAHYGIATVSAQDARRALSNAKRLIRRSEHALAEP